MAARENGPYILYREFPRRQRRMPLARAHERIGILREGAASGWTAQRRVYHRWTNSEGESDSPVHTGAGNFAQSDAAITE